MIPELPLYRLTDDPINNKRGLEFLKRSPESRYPPDNRGALALRSRANPGVAPEGIHRDPPVRLLGGLAGGRGG